MNHDANHTTTMMMTTDRATAIAKDARMTTTLTRFVAAIAAVTFALFATVAAFAAVPPVPETPAKITRLIEARPVSLDESFEHHWRADKPAYRHGYLLVLEVDPDLVYPRQTEEPVLYVGEQTARRLNVGYPSGRVVAFVPVEDPDDYRLDEQRIFFGTPAFPEQVDADRIEREVAAAEAKGVRPVGPQALTDARDEGGERLRVATMHDVMPVAGQLIMKHAPDEKQAADALMGREAQ